MFTGPEIRSSGYGFTTTAIHELGHHFGLSHPHDGYDSATGVDYGPGGDFYFAWLGDEAHSMMSYIDVAWEFGQFDQDNMYRYEFAGYLNWSNEMLDDVLARFPSAATIVDCGAGKSYLGFLMYVTRPRATAARSDEGGVDRGRPPGAPARDNRDTMAG